MNGWVSAWLILIRLLGSNMRTLSSKSFNCITFFNWSSGSRWKPTISDNNGLEMFICVIPVTFSYKEKDWRPGDSCLYSLFEQFAVSTLADPTKKVGMHKSFFFFLYIYTYFYTKTIRLTKILNYSWDEDIIRKPKLSNYLKQNQV